MNKEIVAILNSTPDVIEIIQVVLEDEGFNVVGGLIPQFRRGHKSIIKFMNDHKPDLVIYDIPPPYESNLMFLEMIQNMKVFEGVKSIFTTTNKDALDEMGAGHLKAIEIIGKPMDINQLVTAVRSALGKK